MTPERWRQVERIYQDAVVRAPAERASYLDQACSGDASLRGDVEQMLAGGAESTGLLEAPAMEAVARQLAADAGLLAAGSRIGPYEIVCQLGAGGMGEVYKAHDPRLNRTVAIKRLPAFAAGDAERRKRLLREARAASALKHPHIVSVYDIVSEGGQDFIVMEYLEGRTLGERIGRKGLPVRDALDYAIQIADALSAAHGAGIVHRDVKPGNIMAAGETAGRDTLKVVDFGLAKSSRSLEPDVATASMTAPGVITGTPAYMSPEQAQGKPVDARSDIFSFGSVLYEMLTGRRAFQGETAVSTQAAIVVAEPPPVRDFNRDVPPELERILARCLRKDPARRLQSMADLKVALEDVRDQPEPVTPGPPSRLTRFWVPGVVAATGVIAGGLVVGYWIGSKPVGPRLLSLARITADLGLAETPAISPDGKLVAFASDRSGEGNLDLWVRQVSGGEPIRITHDPSADSEPNFSPDGSHIVFHSARDGGGIYLVSALGGEERLLVRGGAAPRFSPDGKWISYLEGGEGGSSGLRFIEVVAVSGGKHIPIRSELGGILAGIWSPDSRSLLLSGVDPRRDVYEWCVVGVQTGKTRCLDAAAALKSAGLSWPVIYDWAGGYVYLTARFGETGGLWRFPLGLNDTRLSRKAEKLTTGAGEESSPSVAIRPDGTSLIAFSIRNDNRDIWALPLGPGGAAHESGTRLTSSLLADHYPTASADGRWLAYSSGLSLRLKDLREGGDRLLLEGANLDTDRVVALTPDGTHLGVRVGRTVVRLAPADNSTETLLERGVRPEAWTRDQRWLLLMTFDTNDLELLDVAARRTTVILPRPPGWRLHSGHFSPDERWITFHAAPTPEARRIFIAPFRGAEPVPFRDWIAVTDGRNLDREPRWSLDGKLIYFLSDRDGFRCVWAQAVDPANHAVKGSPFPVYHAHNARFTMDLGNDTGPNGLTIVPGQMIVTMAENTGNIWLAAIR